MVQHRATRIITGQFDYINVRGHDLVTERSWQSIEKRRDYFTACLMFKCLDNADPIHLTNEIALVSEIHNVHTRFAQQDNVHVPRPNSELYTKILQIQRSICMECLASGIKTSPEYI